MKTVPLRTVDLQSVRFNMQFHTLAIFLLVAVATISALPVEEEYEELVFPKEVVEVEERADRHRRVTCDLLGGTFGDSACAANCLSMGKAGGKCNSNAVCVCRKEKIKDLWDKRFG